MERQKENDKWEAKVIWGFFIFLAIGLAGISIAKIIMGTIYLHDCDIKKMIPIYLIISGVLPLLFGSFIVRSFRDKYSPFEKLARVFNWSLLAFIINTVWLICGSIWVYPNYWKLTSHYVTCSKKVISNCVHGTCNMTFLKFAFSMVTADWICWICFTLWVIGVIKEAKRP